MKKVAAETQQEKTEIEQLSQAALVELVLELQELQSLSTQEFACATDAINAAQDLSKTMKWHQLSDIETVEKPHYDKAGKPKKDAVPTRISYHVIGTVTLFDSEIAIQRVRCGRFMLATNVLDSTQLSADDALREYKAQQGVERGFRFLKDPLFFASSVFLKSPKRIAALGMILALCLLVYNLGQRQLRQALAQADATIPKQLGKPTASGACHFCDEYKYLSSFSGFTN